MNTRAPIFAALCCVTFPGLSPVRAEPVTVTAQPIDSFKGASPGQSVDGLIWRGGLVLSADADTFGGLSGLTFTGPGGHLAMVTDRGSFVSGQLLYTDGGRPFELVGVEITPIQNSKGNNLPPNYSRDAEAIETIYRNNRPASVRVGFESVTRVADFKLTGMRPGGAAKPVAIPAWLGELRTNTSLEAVCIAPPASPIAGSTLLLAENVKDKDGGHSAWLLGHNDKGPISLVRAPGLNPTDCAFLANGDLLVLERGIGLLSFTMQIRRIDAARVAPGARMTGTVILTGRGTDIDNMEGLAVHTGPDGETRITIISDDNFNDWERSLLLEFELSEDGAPAPQNATNQRPQ